MLKEEENKIILEPKEYDRVMIILHGFGSDSYEFVTLASEFNFPGHEKTKFICPRAPMRPITYLNGEITRAWMDVTSFAKDAEINIHNAEESLQQIESCIEEKIKNGIPAEKIILSGFSQGGAMALAYALLGKYQLAAFIVMSGFLLPIEKFRFPISEVNKKTNIFMHHGRLDDVILPDWAISSQKKVEQYGFKVSLNFYDMVHSICVEELQNINQNIQSSWS